MKKILAITLAVLMLAALAVPAFAADAPVDIDQDAAQQNGAVEVTYGVDQAYIVTIPQDVAFSDEQLSDTRDLSVKDVKIKGNQKITVAIDSLYDYKLVDEDQVSVDVDYTVTPTTYKDDALDVSANVTGSALADGAVALTVNRPIGNDGTDDATKGTVTLTFATNGTSQEGSYIDTLTFTVAIVNDDTLKDSANITELQNS